MLCTIKFQWKISFDKDIFDFRNVLNPLGSRKIFKFFFKTGRLSILKKSGFFFLRIFQNFKMVEENFFGFLSQCAIKTQPKDIPMSK